MCCYIIRICYDPLARQNAFKVLHMLVTELGIAATLNTWIANGC